MLIEMDGIVVEVLRKPIKNMYLRIKPPEGKVKVTAPMKLSLEVIRQHIAFKKEWIETARQRVIARAVPQCSNREDETVQWVWGKAYTCVRHMHAATPYITLEDDGMHWFEKPNTPDAQRRRMLMAWQKEHMQLVLSPLIEHWARVIGVRVHAWTIRAMRSRWGSCHVSTNRITLNLHLIHKPQSCLEYVVVHELVHLLEASHNKRFYALMDRFLPHWKTCKKQLESSPPTRA